MKLLLIISLISTLTISAFATDPLNGTKWKLVGWTISSIDPKDVNITATFSGGRISGNSGVNSYGGNYEAKEGGVFSVGAISMTEMAGPEPAMRAESAYLKLLSDARSYKIKGETLTLYDKNGNESLIFSAAEKAKDPDSSFTIHGRLRQYMGGYPYAIWIVGTKRYLAINQSEPEVFDMPDALFELFAPNEPGSQRCYEQEIFADFVVQPVTPYKEGEMQIVRIISANNIVMTENGKVILKKESLGK